MPAGYAQDGDIEAVTATSMREGMVLYDKQKRELWACPNIDARAAREADELVAEGLATEIYETAGDWLGIISPPRFRWLLRNQPEILDAARQMSMISDWVLFRLCGEIATDPSSGSSSGLFDLRLRLWSETLAAQLGLPAHLFPPVLDSGVVLGSITRQGAAQTGLREGLPVVMGGADTQLAVLGSAAPGTSLTVVGGTFWQTAWISSRALLDPQRRLRTLCHVLAGQWMTEGIGFLNGLAMRWLRDTVFLNNIMDAGDPYEGMESLAAEAPIGSAGITAIVSDVMNAQC